MTKKTLEQLQEQHSEICAAAHDLGLKVPEELTTDFETVEAGETIVRNLDSLIRKFQEGLDDDGKKALAKDDDGEQNETAPSAAKKSRARKQQTKAKPAEAETAGEDKVAKKPKKVVKKAVAKKVAKKANGAARTAFDENAKISWAASKENPAREGTGRHARIEAVRKANGKTVKTFLAAKGNPTTLKNCVAAKLCTVG